MKNKNKFSPEFWIYALYFPIYSLNKLNDNKLLINCLYMINLKQLCEKKHTKYKKNLKQKDLEKRIKNWIRKYNLKLSEVLYRTNANQKMIKKLILAQIKKVLSYQKINNLTLKKWQKN